MKIYIKSNLLTPALGAILGLALTCAPIAAQAQTPPAAPAPVEPTAPKVAKTPYAGSITAIDAASVTVATTSATLTLAITPKTKLAKNRVHAKVTDFAVGDKVTGHYTTDATGAMSASSLYETTPKTTPAPAAQ